MAIFTVQNEPSIVQPSQRRAAFTTDHDARLKCKGCRKISYKTQMFYLQSENASEGQLGHWVCRQCNKYYATKDTDYPEPKGNAIDSDLEELEPDEVRAPSPESQAAQYQLVRRQTASGQRGEPQYPVRAVGPGVVNGYQGQRSAGPSTALPAARHRPHVRVTTGTSIQILAPGNMFPREVLERLSGSVDGISQEKAKILHEQMCLHFQKLASHDAEYVTVIAAMCTFLPGRTKHSIISTIQETISYVPAKITKDDLHLLVYTSLLPQYLAWSHNYTIFTMGDFELKNKKYGPILPATHEHPYAFYDDFLQKKGKSTVKKFYAGDTHVYLKLSHDKLQLIEDHIIASDIDEQRVEVMPEDTTLPSIDFAKLGFASLSESPAGRPISRLTPKDKSGRLALRPGSVEGPVKHNKPLQRSARSSARKRDSEAADLSDNDPPSKSVANPQSEEASRIQAALMKQKAVRKREIQALLSTVTEPVTFYAPKRPAFAQLVSHTDNIALAETNQVKTELVYDVSSNTLFGAFKKGREALVTMPIFFMPGSSLKVCMKQMVYDNPKGPQYPRLPYDNHRQMAKLKGEVSCSIWANALMGLVYDFVDFESTIRGPRDFYVPRMRFVEAGLCIGIAGNPDKRLVALLEEWIDEGSDGPWRKYLGNGSAHVLPLENEEDRNRANFLTFVQHVQYWKTDGLAFVADFQGGDSLLSDPQIITNPALGRGIFAEGNFSPLFDHFPNEHQCNYICEYFGLRSVPQMETDFFGKGKGKAVSAVGTSQHPIDLNANNGLGTIDMDISQA